MLRQLDGTLQGESRYSGLIVLASLYVGPNEEKVSLVTRIPLAKVSEKAKRLRENGVWNDQGKISLDMGDGSDHEVTTIALIMAFMCADGLVNRVREEELGR